MLDWQKVIDGILTMHPGPIRLKNPQWRAWTLFSIGAPFGTAAVLLSGIVDTFELSPEHHLLAALLLVPFAALMGLAVRDLRAPHLLVLDAECFQFVRGHQVETFDWADAESFRVFMDCGQMRVTFRHDDRDVTVPDDYGMPATPLCMLLEQWQAKVLQARTLA